MLVLNKKFLPILIKNNLKFKAHRIILSKVKNFKANYSRLKKNLIKGGIGKKEIQLPSVLQWQHSDAKQVITEELRNPLSAIHHMHQNTLARTSKRTTQIC